MPKDKIIINFIVQDEKRQPLQGALLACKNGRNTVFAEISSKEGLSMIYSEGRLIESIDISFIGYEESKINISSLWGYELTIEVLLHRSPEFEYISECLERYLIIKNTNSELHLAKLGKEESKLFLDKK